jgi:hypothetical protein
MLRNPACSISSSVLLLPAFAMAPMLMIYPWLKAVQFYAPKRK